MRRSANESAAAFPAGPRLLAALEADADVGGKSGPAAVAELPCEEASVAATETLPCSKERATSWISPKAAVASPSSSLFSLFGARSTQVGDMEPGFRLCIRGVVETIVETVVETVVDFGWGSRGAGAPELYHSMPSVA